MEEEAPPLALGHTDAIRQCEEIKNSEVNQCPLEDLRMVLEEGASVALRTHQKNCVARFRENVEDGAMALNKFKVLSYRFANITDLPPGEQFQKYPAGVYLYRASNNLIHVIKPSDEYRERMNKVRLFTFELCLERLSRNRAKFFNVKVDKSSSGHRRNALQIVMLTKKLANKIQNYLQVKSAHSVRKYKNFPTHKGFVPPPERDFSAKTNSSVSKVQAQLDAGTFDFGLTPAREDPSLKDMFFIRSDGRTTDPAHRVYFAFCPEDSQYNTEQSTERGVKQEKETHRRTVIRMNHQEGGVHVGNHFKRKMFSHTKTYHNCFRGKDAIQWMMNFKPNIKTKRAAISYCDVLLDLGYIQSCKRALKIRELIHKEEKAVQDYSNYRSVLIRWLRDINLAKYKDAFLEKIMAPSDFKLFSNKDLLKMKMTKSEIKRFQEKAFDETKWNLVSPEEELRTMRRNRFGQRSLRPKHTLASAKHKRSSSGTTDRSTATYRPKRAFSLHFSSTSMPILEAPSLFRSRSMVVTSVAEKRTSAEIMESFWKCYDAITDSDPKTLRSLLMTLKDNQSLAHKKTTLLHCACEAGRVECVRALVDYLISSDQREQLLRENDWGMTSSELALKSKHYAINELVRSKSFEKERFNIKRFYRFMIGRHTPDANAPIRTDGKHSKIPTEPAEPDSQSVYEASAAQTPGSLKFPNNLADTADSVTPKPVWDRRKPNRFLIHRVIMTSAFRNLWSKYCSQVCQVCDVAKRFNMEQTDTKSIDYIDYHKIIQGSAEGYNIPSPYHGSLMPEHCATIDHIHARGTNHATCRKFHYRDEGDVVNFFSNILNDTELLVVNMRVLARYHGEGDYYPGTITKVHDDGTYEIVFQRGEKDDEVLRKDIKGPKLRRFEEIISTSDVEQTDKPSAQFIGLLEMAGIDDRLQRRNALNAIQESLIRPAYLAAVPGLSSEFLTREKFEFFREGGCVLGRDSNSTRFFIVIRGMCKLLNYTSASNDAKPDDELVLNVGAWFSKYGLLKGEDRAVVAGKGGCCVMSVDQGLFIKCLETSPSFEAMISERTKLVASIFKARHKKTPKIGKQLYECEDYSQTSMENNKFVVFTPATATNGEKYNDYEVTGYLGQGKYGRVHKVKDQFGAEFAMKVVFKQVHSKGGATTLNKVIREIKLMRSVKYPHIVLLKEVLFPHGADDPNKSAKICIVQELCAGGQSMSNTELQDGTATPQPPAEVWKMFRQLLNAVAHLHKQEFIHGDIKPENLLLHADGNVKLVDFGESKHIELSGIDGVEKSMDEVIGTPMFMAPEVWRINGAYSGTLADMYSMGVTLYALMFGRLPFIGQSFEQLCREKELPIVVSFWPRSIGLPRMSPVASTPPGSPKPGIASSMSKRFSKGKFMVDCKSELLRKIPEEIDRQYKVLRWPDLNDLLQKLLHPRPSMRPSADKVKDHPWVTLNGLKPMQEVGYR